MSTLLDKHFHPVEGRDMYCSRGVVAHTDELREEWVKYDLAATRSFRYENQGVSFNMVGGLLVETRGQHHLVAEVDIRLMHLDKTLVEHHFATPLPMTTPLWFPPLLVSQPCCVEGYVRARGYVIAYLGTVIHCHVT